MDKMTDSRAVAWRGRGKNGWIFTDSPHAHDIAVGIWDPLYAAPPSAPVGVEGSLDRLRQHRSQRLWEADLVGGRISVERMRAILHVALAQQPAAVDGAIAGWIADGDTIPAHLIEATRDAIRLEFGNNGTDGYYKRILVRVFTALAAKPGGSDNDR